MHLQPFIVFQQLNLLIIAVHGSEISNVHLTMNMNQTRFFTLHIPTVAIPPCSAWMTFVSSFAAC